MSEALAARERLLEELDGSRVDLLVIGAGIVGSRVAYEAAHRGLRVALVDAGDFGGETSSASSKLVHGGLRYLSTGDVRLVRRLQAERLTLMSTIAPHLVRPLPLLLVVPRAQSRDVGTLVAALGVYGAIGGWRDGRPRIVGRERARTFVPALDPAAIAVCGLVPEAQTHDARLTLATVRAAAAAGAATLNYVRLVAFEHAGGAIARAVLRDDHGDRELTVSCHAVVNATGPWVDRIRCLDDDGAPPMARLSKGVHAVLPLERPWTAGIALLDASRSALAVPWQGMLLAGASDSEYDGDPGDLVPTAEDVDGVLAPLAGFVEAGLLRADRVVHSFAGLRVLVRGPGDTARVSREHLVATSRTGLISVAGGKLTTHRPIAIDVLQRLPAEIRPRLEPLTRPLPGSERPVDERLLSGLDPDVASHLRGLYGGETGRVLAYAASVPDALERIDDRGPDVRAQIHFARDFEYALTCEDIVSRRTTLAVRGLATECVRERVADHLAALRQLVGAAGSSA